MSKENIATYPEVNVGNLIETIIDGIRDIKGKNIVKIDLTKLDDGPTDFFLVCEGDSTTQVNAIAQNVQKRLKDLGVRVLHSEGQREGKWVLLDYFEVVVHVFHPETRRYYDVEDLWSDGDFTEYQEL